MSMEDRADPVALFREREEKRAANNPNANIDERVEQDIIRQIRDGKETLEQKQSLYKQLSPEKQRSTPTPTQGLDRDQLQKYKDKLMDSMLTDPKVETENKIRNVEDQLERQFAVEPLYKKIRKDDPQILKSIREKLVGEMLSNPTVFTQDKISAIDKRLDEINSRKPTISQGEPVSTTEVAEVDNSLPDFPPEWDLLNGDGDKADIVITQKEFDNELEKSKQKGSMNDIFPNEVPHFVSDEEADRDWKKQEADNQKKVSKRWGSLWRFFKRTPKE